MNGVIHGDIDSRHFVFQSDNVRNESSLNRIRLVGFDLAWIYDAKSDNSNASQWEALKFITGAWNDLIRLNSCLCDFSVGENPSATPSPVIALDSELITRGQWNVISKRPDYARYKAIVERITSPVVGPTVTGVIFPDSVDAFHRIQTMEELWQVLHGTAGRTDVGAIPRIVRVRIDAETSPF